MKKEDKEQSSDELSVKFKDALVYQPWSFTKLKYNFTKIEKNIFLKIIECSQNYLNRVPQSKKIKFELKEMFNKEFPVITFPYSDLVTTKHVGTEVFKAALGNLIRGKNAISIPCEETGWDFHEIAILSEVKSSDKRGMAEITLTPSFWEKFLEANIFKIIDPKISSTFKSVYTSRLYELLLDNQREMTYKIENLMEMFCKESYSTSAFISRVIKVAYEEMKVSEKCPFYFEYKVNKVGRRIDSITFMTTNKQSPVQQDKASEKVEDPDPKKMLLVFLKTFFEVAEVPANVLNQISRLEEKKGITETCVFVYNTARKILDRKQKGILQDSPLNSLSSILECTLYAEQNSPEGFEFVDVPVTPQEEVQVTPQDKCLSAIQEIKQDSEYMQKIAAHHNVSVQMIEAVLDRIVKNADMNGTWSNDDSVEKVKKHLMNAGSIISVIKNSKMSNSGYSTASAQSKIQRREIEIPNIDEYNEW